MTNQSVLEQSHCKVASMLLLERQMTWMGGLAARPNDHILKQAVFEANNTTFKPRVPHGLRERGRPKTCWATYVFQHALEAAGGNRPCKPCGKTPPAPELHGQDVLSDTATAECCCSGLAVCLFSLCGSLEGCGRSNSPGLSMFMLLADAPCIELECFPIPMC